MESSRDFTTLEEEIYWKNFHFAQFSLVLSAGFQQSLALPKKFTEYMRSKLPDNVILKVNGVAWNVSIEKSKDDVMLKGLEWEHFARAYSLKKGDLVIFKYNRQECFEILIFDHANSCERELSYFVRKSQLPLLRKDADSNGAREMSTEVTDISQQEDGDSDYAAFCIKLRKKTRSTSKGISSARANRVIIQDGNSEETSDEEISISEQPKTPKKASDRRVREVPCNALRKRKCDDISEPKTMPKDYYRGGLYKSNRRSVTEEEKLKALKLAKTKSVEYQNSFIVVMRPTSVYKRFFMTIPVEVRAKSQFRDFQEMILQVQNKTWRCSFFKGGLQAGWKKFALENFLEEFDVCLFVPTEQKNGKYVFDVSIFRVVQEIVALSQINP